MIPTNVPIKADFVFPSWRFHEQPQNGQFEALSDICFPQSLQ